MAIKVEVNFYKESGKWYSTEEFTAKDDIQIFESDKIEEEIKQRYSMARFEMNFTFEAHCDQTKGMNKRLIINTL